MHYGKLTHSIIALNRLTTITKHTTCKIIESVENPENADYMTFIEQGVRMNYLNRRTPIGDFIDAYDYAGQVLERCQEEDISIVNAYSDDYPLALRFEDSPVLFYYKGDLNCLQNPKRAAVVGTRSPNESGRQFAYDSGCALADSGYTVVSGLAVGCDTAAHTGCLDHHGKTVAFVPSNLSMIMPKRNKSLADRIVAEGGLLISEFSPLTTPHAGMYIERDRLQAAASNQVFVSEFDAQSGTLQTLQYASQFDKPIYTLKALAEDPEFNGYEALNDLQITCHALDCEELHQILKIND